MGVSIHGASGSSTAGGGSSGYTAGELAWSCQTRLAGALLPPRWLQQHAPPRSQRCAAWAAAGCWPARSAACPAAEGGNHSRAWVPACSSSQQAAAAGQQQRGPQPASSQDRPPPLPPAACRRTSMRMAAATAAPCCGSTPQSAHSSAANSSGVGCAACRSHRRRSLRRRPPPSTTSSLAGGPEEGGRGGGVRGWAGMQWAHSGAPCVPPSAHAPEQLAAWLRPGRRRRRHGGAPVGHLGEDGLGHRALVLGRHAQVPHQPCRKLGHLFGGSRGPQQPILGHALAAAQAQLDRHQLLHGC